MKQAKKQWTTEEATRLFRENGEANPTPEQIERSRRILNICEEQVGLTDWNEQLYPKLDDLADVEVFQAIEESFGVRISDAVYEETDARTFGDLVLFFDEQIAFIVARCAHEKAKLDSAACATQTAFYLLRRRLCDAGVSYYQTHDFRPDTTVLDLAGKQAEKFVDGLRNDYGFPLCVRRVLWGRVRTSAVYGAYLLMLGILGVLIAHLLLDNPVLNAALFAITWAISGVAVSRIVNRHAQYRIYGVSRNYQTLGDLARQIAAAPQNQTARANL